MGRVFDKAFTIVVVKDLFLPVTQSFCTAFSSANCSSLACTALHLLLLFSSFASQFGTLDNFELMIIMSS